MHRPSTSHTEAISATPAPGTPDILAVPDSMFQGVESSQSINLGFGRYAALINSGMAGVMAL